MVDTSLFGVANERASRTRTHRADFTRTKIALRLGLIVATFFVVSCGQHSAAPSTSTPSGAPKGAQFRLRDFHLKSGIRVLFEEDHSAPIVGIVNVVGVGASSDPPGKEGLAHLVEHLTFRAKASEQTFWSLLEQAGGSQKNATTDLDSTTYWAFGPRDAALDLLSLEGIRIVDPLAGVDEATFAVEREVVRNELRQRGETIVQGAVWAALAKATYPAAHPYSRAPIGTHQSLDAITLADAQAFVKQHYRPSNMTVIVSGDISLENADKLVGGALAPTLNQTAPLAKEPPRLDPKPPEPPAPPPATGLPTIEGMVTAPEIYVSWSLPRAYGEANPLGAMATAGVRSAISHGAREDNDLIGGGVSLSEGARATTVIAHLLLREGSHPEKSVELFLNGLVYNWLTGQSGQMEHAAFERRIARLATFMLEESDDIVSRAIERATFTHFAGDPGFLGRRMDAINAIGPSKLEDFYKTYLNRDRARAVLVRPIGSDSHAALGRGGVQETSDVSANAKFDVSALGKVATSVGFAPSFHRRTLGNGLTVYTARHGGAPMASIGLDFDGGLAEEAEAGAATIAWAVATPGNSLHGELYEFGTSLESDIEADRTTFRTSVLSAHLERVLAILADRVTSLEVRTSPFAGFEKYALSYFRRTQTRPEFISNRDFRQALFASHPLGHVSEIPEDHYPNMAAANRWIETVIAPARGTLAIVGDIDPDEAQRLVESAFGGWSRKGAPAPAPPSESGGGRSTIVTARPGATQAEIRVGCRLPPLQTNDAMRVGVLSRLVDQRLRSIREQRGSSYGLVAHPEIVRGRTGFLTIAGAVDNANLSMALRTIRQNLATGTALRNNELNRAKWLLASEYNLELRTPRQWLERILDVERQGFGVASVDREPEDLRSLDLKPFLTALGSCPTTGVLAIVGDEILAKKAIKESWAK